MGWMKNPGRHAGLLYLLGYIPGFFGLLYVPSKLMVDGNPTATATAHHIAASETLFRLGIFANLAGQTIFIFVALALYHLFKEVNERHAVLMVVLLLVSIPVAFLNEVNSVVALPLVRGANFLSVYNEPQRVAWMRLFLNLRGIGFDVAGIFWGLWLFPLGLLSTAPASSRASLASCSCLAALPISPTASHPSSCRNMSLLSPDGYAPSNSSRCSSCLALDRGRKPGTLCRPDPPAIDRKTLPVPRPPSQEVTSLDDI